MAASLFAFKDEAHSCPAQAQVWLIAIYKVYPECSIGSNPYPATRVGPPVGLFHSKAHADVVLRVFDPTRDWLILALGNHPGARISKRRCCPHCRLASQSGGNYPMRKKLSWKRTSISAIFASWSSKARRSLQRSVRVVTVIPYALFFDRGTTWKCAASAFHASFTRLSSRSWRPLIQRA